MISKRQFNKYFGRKSNQLIFEYISTLFYKHKNLKVNLIIKSFRNSYLNYIKKLCLTYKLLYRIFDPEKDSQSHYNHLLLY